MRWHGSWYYVNIWRVRGREWVFCFPCMLCTKYYSLFAFWATEKVRTSNFHQSPHPPNLAIIIPLLKATEAYLWSPARPQYHNTTNCVSACFRRGCQSIKLYYLLTIVLAENASQHWYGICLPVVQVDWRQRVGADRLVIMVGCRTGPWIQIRNHGGPREERAVQEIKHEYVCTCKHVLKSVCSCACVCAYLCEVCSWMTTEERGEEGDEGERVARWSGGGWWRDVFDVYPISWRARETQTRNTESDSLKHKWWFSSFDEKYTFQFEIKHGNRRREIRLTHRYA
jgi:hypothetical protein